MSMEIRNPETERPRSKSGGQKKSSTYVGLLRCARRVPGSGVLKDPDSPLLIADVDIATSIHQHILRLSDELRRKRTEALGRSGRHKPTHFLRHSRIHNIENAKSRIEVGQINQICLFLHV